MVEFVYNSVYNEAIGCMLFFANYRFELQAYKELQVDQSRAQWAITIAQELKELQARLAIDI